MMFKALKEQRISRPVILEIKREIVNRPGVLFSERNAASTGVATSANANVIHFDIVKKAYRSVPDEKKAFYQGEVLIPDCVPPHLIAVDALNSPLSVPLSILVPEAEGKKRLPMKSRNQSCLM
jgi:hypothetical protein